MGAAGAASPSHTDTQKHRPCPRPHGQQDEDASHRLPGLQTCPIRASSWAHLSSPQSCRTLARMYRSASGRGSLKKSPGTQGHSPGSGRGPKPRDSCSPEHGRVPWGDHAFPKPSRRAKLRPHPEEQEKVGEHQTALNHGWGPLPSLRSGKCCVSFIAQGPASTRRPRWPSAMPFRRPQHPAGSSCVTSERRQRPARFPRWEARPLRDPDAQVLSSPRLASHLSCQPHADVGSDVSWPVGPKLSKDTRGGNVCWTMPELFPAPAPRRRPQTEPSPASDSKARSATPLSATGSEPQMAPSPLRLLGQ